jgi:16S rRNA processing protein RimM
VTSVRVGRVGRVHGLRGEIVLEGVALTPDELRSVLHFTWRGPTGDERPLKLAAARPTHDRVLARFEGFDDCDQARVLTRGELFADSAALPDPGPTTAYTFQLVGLLVRTEDGRELGRLTDIVTTGANPIYVVRGDRERLLPAPPEFVRQVDLTAGVITMALPPGFEDL